MIQRKLNEAILSYAGENLIARTVRMCPSDIAALLAFKPTQIIVVDSLKGHPAEPEPETKLIFDGCCVLEDKSLEPGQWRFKTEPYAKETSNRR